MDVVAAMHRLGGLAERRELLLLTSRGELERALAGGAVRRARRNLYVLPAADTASVAARTHRGAVSHLSAALAWGWRVKEVPARPVVSVARNRHPRPDPGVDLRYAVLAPADLAHGRTSRVRTALDCARSLPFDEALAVVDSALRSRTVSRDELELAAAAGPRNGRAAALRVVRAASARAANPFESVLRAQALEVPGLEPVAQGAVGPQWHADVADLGLRIAVEAESFEFHALPEAFRHDIRRYTSMTRLGWLVVRFLWEDVMHRPAYVREVLTDVVRLRQEEAARHPAG